MPRAAEPQVHLYEEEDTCHMRRSIHVMYIYEEEDTCHASNLAQIDMRRRIHVIRGGGYMSYEEEDTCHMRRRIHVLRPILLR
jgi:hypothetical protein